MIPRTLCTAARCMNADTTHPQYEELYTLIMKVLTIANKNDYHSLLRQVRKMKHANKRKNPQLYAAYDAVDNLLEIKATRAASSFRCNPAKTENYPNLTLDKMRYFWEITWMLIVSVLFLPAFLQRNRKYAT